MFAEAKVQYKKKPLNNKIRYFGPGYKENLPLKT